MSGDRSSTPEVEWVTCRCGKERQLWGDDLRRRLGKVSLCGSCNADMGRDLDCCPESLRIPNGVSGCVLGWKHEGRCRPFDLLAAEQSDDSRTPE